MDSRSHSFLGDRGQPDHPASWPNGWSRYSANRSWVSPSGVIPTIRGLSSVKSSLQVLAAPSIHRCLCPRRSQCRLSARTLLVPPARSGAFGIAGHAGAGLIRKAGAGNSRFRLAPTSRTSPGAGPESWNARPCSRASLLLTRWREIPTIRARGFRLRVAGGQPTTVRRAPPSRACARTRAQGGI